MPATNQFCSECGANLASGAKFCASCGTRVAPTTQQPAADRPQVVIPRRSAGQAGGQQAPRPRQSSTSASAPVTIVINGQQTSGNQYAGMRGYRCASCGSFVYQGGPACGCGWGIGDFIALGLEAEAVGDLFAGDGGDAAADLMIAGMIGGGRGGFGYAPYGGGLYGGGGLVGDLLMLDAIEELTDDDRGDRDDQYGGGDQDDQYGGQDTDDQYGGTSDQDDQYGGTSDQDDPYGGGDFV